MRMASRTSEREAVEPAGAALGRCIRAALIRVRRIPGGERTSDALVGPEAIRMSDLRRDRARRRRPVRTRLSDDQSAVGVRSGEDVVLVR